MRSVGDVIATVERLAPPAWAAEWDNVGLLSGSPAAPVGRCLVALDCDGATLDEAVDRQAQLVVCHHPVVFRPLRRVDPADPAVRAAVLGVAVYCAHTNLDVACVSEWLAERLGLDRTEVLQPTVRERHFKLVTFVPASHAEAVRAALAAAGAGRLGDYDSCSFQSSGTGAFRPLAAARPFVGSAGRLERVDETRLEVLVPEGLRDPVLAALRASHPYEEIAFDLFELANGGPERGFGRVGRLTAGPLPLAAFAGQVGQLLGCSAVVRWAGVPDRPIERVAVCGGAGADLVEAALAAGADVLVTGDLKYHQARAAVASGLALVDAGHFATENVLVPALAGWLRQRLEGLEVLAGERASDVWRGV